MNVLFRCDASSEIGLGHIVRCFALAEELYSNYNCTITFVSRESNVQIAEIVKPFQVTLLDTEISQEKYESVFLQIVAEKNSKAVIFDIRDGMNNDVIGKLKSEGIITATIDDPEDKRLFVDMVFCPPVPQVKQVSWEGFGGELYVGFEYVLLRKEFAKKYPRPKNKTRKVLVTMGGSDPMGLTFKVVEALELVTENFIGDIVLGSGFTRFEELEKQLEKSSKQYSIHRNVSNMAQIMKDADIAVVSFGMTAYELIAIGVPSIHVCLTEDHNRSAKMVTDNGLGINLGLYTDVSKDKIAETVTLLLSDTGVYKEMVHNLENVECGLGIKKISSIITRKAVCGE